MGLLSHLPRLSRHGFLILMIAARALPLLQASGIEESKGFGGFPVSGQWLRCDNPEVVKHHQAKVYSQAAVGSPPMSVPHLDTRVVDGKKSLLFGPYAGFTTKFLKHGSFLDLPLSVRPNNLGPMLAVARDNLDLTRYLIKEVMQSEEQRLNTLREQYKESLCIVMRTYFEKPRTIVGWKGLINDPRLDGSFDVNEGLKLARQLLVDINEMGMPTATEFLDMVTGQYISDLITWGAIGARTTESQVHREMASALSCPVGFKNGTDGNTRIAIDAVRAARHSHIFYSPDKDGKMTIYRTAGNPYGHVILRGGHRPNYDTASIDEARIPSS